MLKRMTLMNNDINIVTFSNPSVASSIIIPGIDQKFRVSGLTSFEEPCQPQSADEIMLMSSLPIKLSINILHCLAENVSVGRVN